jgi:nucleoside-diphosphate-sugar epimerase
LAVLVSGAAGFLGRQLVARLAEEGRDVVAVTRGPIPSELAGNSRVRWLQWDIARDDVNPEALSGLEAVVHLAGATLGAGKDEVLFLRANEQTTVRLFQAVAGRSDRFIFASSQVVYGDAKHLSVTEEFPLRPESSAYACSKINGENWLQWFQRRHGGQYLALRLCGLVDGGGIVDYLIDTALAGQTMELYSEGRVRRDYLPSENAIDLFVAALNFKAEPGFLPVNVGSGQAVAARELAELVYAEIQGTGRVELRETPSPQGDFVFCIDRAKQLFGFQPGSLREAVRRHARNRRLFASGQVSNAAN